MNPIETHQLSGKYGRTEALKELSLSVPEGSVTALLGANGAGKTTTIKLLMNFRRPTGGSARVLGVDTRKLSEKDRTRLGYVAENQELPRWMTVRQLLDYCRPFYPTWDSTLERTLLDRFELPEFTRLKALSRGMVMKVSLIAALAYRPDLIVMDEPFSGLDSVVRDDLIDGILEAANSRKCTVLISSHDLAEIERVCDRIAFLREGRLEFAETTEALQQRYRRIEVNTDDVVGREVPAGLPPRWKAVKRSGRRIEFIDSNFSPDSTEAECRQLFPASSVYAHPMTLREIFASVSRTKSGQSSQPLTS